MWIVFSFIAALFTTLTHALRKRVAGRIHLDTINFLSFFVALPFAVLYLFSQGIPDIKSTYWFAGITHVIIDFIAFTLLMKALQKEDISLVTPFISFSNIFIVFWSPFLIGEYVSLFGLAGIILGVIGSYFMNLSLSKYHFLDPIKELFRNKSILYALIVAFLWSFAAIAFKVAQQSSSPAFHAAFQFAGLSILFGGKILWNGHGKEVKRAITSDTFLFVALGLTNFIIMIAQSWAYIDGTVSYVSAIKRLNILFDLAVGGLLLKERNFGERMAGAAIILVGILLIIILG